MTQKEKQLLLKDLCARLPYGVKAKITEEGVLSYDSGIGVIVGKEHADNEIFTLQCKNDSWCLTAISEFVPYLRPMSSMTEEERKEYKDMNVLDNCDEFSNIKKNIEDIKKNGEENYIQLPRTHAQDYLNSIHVDYRGLIPMGLALPAPEGMYNN